MPKKRPVVASFWVLRPQEHPEAAARNYPGMLRILDRSCARQRMKHVVLTDRATRESDQWPEGVEGWVCPDLPAPLMNACTEVQARFLETMQHDMRMGSDGSDVLFVGADCIFLNDPLRFLPEKPDVIFTYRDPTSRYPINTGLACIRAKAIDNATALYRRVADRCGAKWCDDQLSLVAELAPMPKWRGIHERAGMRVGFLPMNKLNALPTSVSDPCIGALMLHFRGKGRKQFFFEWAARHGYA